MSASRAEKLEQLARLCRHGHEGPPARVEPSGSANLDAVLPGGGWQAGTVVELMPVSEGIGELQLLMPALAKITQGERHVAMIAPPYIPYAPALLRHGLRLEHFWIIRAQSATDILWSAEQTLRCKSFGAVLAWPQAIRDREVRRLQLAAEAGNSVGFVYRPPSAARESSPAAVRLRLQSDASGQLNIDVVKCRGARAGMTLAVSGWRSGVSQNSEADVAVAPLYQPLSANR
ncbi:translesion DNA synthesis-associated protein ImuA [Steroidobacter sp. S1-65]|uniref:Translesion DNA synthesis-associated protein ImuA n=1 Tax=Steroidobacter gossypii TaxID=2805490 RepID=A0ABS1X434_9GAMM|nr:translesion DNA synthesis-associated protein ImuA [Steroidobacter gossypii]MBM0107980.1 translesion DNA synthesis-associated protein ImuA [Steroidobacter gossypii]